jgi:hypothetical protein
MAEAIRVEGLTRLSRAFNAADKTLTKQLKVELRAAAEPVRADAEGLAVSGIRNIGVPWSRMRVGVTTKMVYVAPRQRGKRTLPQNRRPNLKPLLLRRSMEPALERNKPEVIRSMEHVLDDVGHAFGRAR